MVCLAIVQPPAYQLWSSRDRSIFVSLAEGYRTGRIQYRKDADRRDAGKEGFRIGGFRAWEAGQEGCKT